MSARVLFAAAMLVAISAPLPAQSVKAGIEAWQRADYAGAMAIWRPLAEKGDADAAFNLGQAYRLGRGVPTNLAVARTWFERAASQGHVDAQATLGLLMFQNGDQAGGLKWLKQAAEQGEPRALLVYGTALYNGDGVTQNQVLGYAYVSRAAAQGLGPAKETLTQLDKLMPVGDRKKGVALAKTKAKNAPPSGSKAAKPPKVAAAAKPKPPAEPPAKPPAEPPAKLAETPAPKPVETAIAKPAAEPPAKLAAKPPAKPAAKPASAPAASGAWRIQLGAFSQKGNAEALYKKLSGNGALAGRRPFYIPVGAITRLQVGPFESRSAAAAACKSLGTACFPVPAK
jgi:cell division protein FtsN